MEFILAKISPLKSFYVIWNSLVQFYKNKRGDEDVEVSSLNILLLFLGVSLTLLRHEAISVYLNSFFSDHNSHSHQNSPSPSLETKI